jgi:hypothetical protein
MSQFIVEVREVHISHRSIEAEDQDQAVLMVEEGEGEEVYLEFSDTKDKSTWSVRKVAADSPTFYHNPITGKFDKKI